MCRRNLRAREGVMFEGQRPGDEEMSRAPSEAMCTRVHPGRNGELAVRQVLALTVAFCRDLICQAG